LYFDVTVYEKKGKALATLKDISKLANISTATISRFLNEDPTLSVSQGKKHAILQAVEELGYVSPKRSKKQYVHVPSYELLESEYQNDFLMVNFLTPTQEIDDPYFTSIRAGIQNRCLDQKIHIRSIHKHQIEQNSTLLKQVPGVIAVGHFSEAEVESMYQYNRNLIFVDSNPLGNNADAILLDRIGLAREVVEKIIQQGCKTPAFIGNNEARLHTFREVTRKHNLYQESLCKVSKEYCIESGYQAMLEMLNQQVIPDAVYAATDMVAVGVYRAIYESGLSIPGDIQVIGTNDISSARHMNPSLTTMRLYPFEMGETAVDLLIEIINGRKCKKTILFSYDFIWRDSFTKYAS